MVAMVVTMMASRVGWVGSGNARQAIATLAATLMMGTAAVVEGCKVIWMVGVKALLVGHMVAAHRATQTAMATMALACAGRVTAARVNMAGAAKTATAVAVVWQGMAALVRVWKVARAVELRAMKETAVMVLVLVQKGGRMVLLKVAKASELQVGCGAKAHAAVEVMVVGVLVTAQASL